MSSATSCAGNLSIVVVNMPVCPSVHLNPYMSGITFWGQSNGQNLGVGPATKAIGCRASFASYIWAHGNSSVYS